MVVFFKNQIIESVKALLKHPLKSKLSTEKLT